MTNLKRPCVVCGQPCVGSRCPAHALAAKPRPKTAARGYGSRWRRLAKQAKERWPYCCECGATNDLTVDHLLPGKEAWTLDDVQVLCRGCNSRKGAPKPGEEPLPAPLRDLAPQSKFPTHGPGIA